MEDDFSESTKSVLIGVLSKPLPDTLPVGMDLELVGKQCPECGGQMVLHTYTGQGNFQACAGLNPVKVTGNGYRVWKSANGCGWFRRTIVAG